MGNSPSIMLDTELHRQAASTLNLHAHRQNIRQNMLHRLVPNSERIRTISKYVKNTAIGAAGTGGVILTANQFSSVGENIVNDSASSSSTTTIVPEIYNPIGENI